MKKLHKILMFNIYYYFLIYKFKKYFKKLQKNEEYIEENVIRDLQRLGDKFWHIFFCQIDYYKNPRCRFHFCFSDGRNYKNYIYKHSPDIHIIKRIRAIVGRKISDNDPYGEEDWSD